ncbi:MAG: DUF4037 domain-containing protein [Filifactoraceae bacterium]
MKGMELSKLYYEAYGKPMIESKFYQYKNHIAIGLVGEGSQCFGFDDVYSQDHDFEPGFCMWVSGLIYNEIATSLKREYEALPKNFMGYDNNMQLAEGRMGVFEIESFYHKYTNCGSTPRNIVEWMKIPERFLATATNGQVFFDGNGEFTKARENLLNFYPDDVLKKKLASKTAIMAQAGQYNYLRSAKRHDLQASYFACNEFIKNALSAIFLLNRRYMPFYKWAFRGAEELRFLKEPVETLKKLTLIPDEYENTSKKFEMIEYICYEIAKELRLQSFCKTTNSFLESHAIELMKSIEDPRIRALHIMADFD